jgi:hypothetical protein
MINGLLFHIAMDVNFDLKTEPKSSLVRSRLTIFGAPSDLSQLVWGLTAGLARWPAGIGFSSAGIDSDSVT